MLWPWMTLQQNPHFMMREYDQAKNLPGKVVMGRILVVEDNPANMRFAVTVLSSAGHRVLQSGDAAIGIRAVGFDGYLSDPVSYKELLAATGISRPPQ